MSRSTRTTLVLALLAGGRQRGQPSWCCRQVQQHPGPRGRGQQLPGGVAAKDPAGGQPAVRRPTSSWSPGRRRVRSPAPSLRVEEVVNRGLMASVLENEPLTEHQAGRDGGRRRPAADHHAGHARHLGEGRRGGRRRRIRRAGRQVDVVVTIEPAAAERVARRRQQHHRCWPPGPKIDQDQARDGRPVPTTVVTLLVTPEDAERISLASSVGRITLTLRNPLDVTSRRRRKALAWPA